ncbi:MAG: NFACT family protein [Candidatus Diapherotrites archaeon]|nr:NFACT family protein [Candidatus Diapherotrites archaeon]
MEEISLSNLALKHLVEELQVLVNGFVNKVQVLENHWIKMKVHTKNGGKDLVISPNSFFISEYSIPARMQPSGYPSLLKKYLFNQRVVSITQKGVDRIVVLEFPEHFLVLELFAKGNIILCDREMKIIKARWKEEWKDRKLEKDEIYRPPSSRGANPLEENEKDFFEKLKSNRKTFFGATVDLLNAAPAIIEFVFEKNGFDKKKNAAEAEEKETKKVLEEVKKIYSEKECGAFLNKKVIYSAEIGLEKEIVFESINSALNSLLVKSLFGEAQKKGEQKEKEFNPMPAEKAIEAKKNEIERLIEEEKELQKKGEKIYLNYKKISEIISAVQKAKAKNLVAKEIKEKINAIDDVLEEIDLKNGKLLLKLK